MLRNISRIVLFLVICWGCAEEKPKTEKYQYERKNVIHVKDKLKEIEVDYPLLSSSSRLHIIDDYLLIADYKSYDHLIHLFDKKTFRYITGIAYKGQGPGEIANLGDIGIDHAHRRFNVTDYGKNAIFSYSLDNVLADSTYIPEKKVTIQADKIIVDYQYINDTECIGLILEPISPSDYKVATGILNMHSGEFKLMPYVHPKINRKRASFDASLEHGLYVECYHLQNLMTICTLDGKLKYNVYGGDNWPENNRGQFEYYKQVAFIDNKICVLYLRDNAFINDPVKGIVGNQATKFLVFDLDGNYLATLETGYRISNFCYDKANNRLVLCMNDEIQFAYLDLDGLID